MAVAVAACLSTCRPSSIDPVDPLLLQAQDWYTGVTGRVDDSRARELLLAAAEDGDALSRMWVARCLSRGRMGFARDEGRARALADSVFPEVARSARAGVTEAVFLMGTAYDEGLGVDENPALAVEWHRRAAELGHVLAQHNLGNAYSAGRGIARDDEEAMAWWRRAAVAGDAVAELRLGEMYEAGRGVTRDSTAAAYWYRRAAQRGNRTAGEALERLAPGA